MNLIKGSMMISGSLKEKNKGHQNFEARVRELLTLEDVFLQTQLFPLTMSSLPQVS